MMLEQLRANTRKRGNHSALVQGSICLSYNDMWRLVDHYAKILKHYKLGKGDIIGLIAPNAIENAIIYLSIWEIKAVPYPFGEYNDFLRCLLASDEAPKAILIYKPWINIDLSHTLKQYYLQLLSITQSGLTLYVKSAQNRFNNNNLGNETFVWLSSSGTTGESKIIKLGLHGTLANIRANVESLCLCEDDCTLMCLPMRYSYGLIGQFLSHLYVGSKIVFPIRINLIHTIPILIRQQQITTMFTVPTLLRSLITVLSNIQDVKASMSSLRLLTVGGGAIDKYWLQRALDLLKDTAIAVTYGLTEAGPRVSTYIVQENPFYIGSVGRPIKGVEVAIVDYQGNELSYNQQGEIVVFSASVMQGYAFNSGEKDYIPGKMLYTSDRGYVSKDGYIYILGRNCELININGNQIYFNELKEFLYSDSNILHVEIEPVSSENETLLVLHIVPKPGKKLNKAVPQMIATNCKFSSLLDKIDIKFGHCLKANKKCSV